MVAVKKGKNKKGLLDDIGDLAGLLDRPLPSVNSPIMIPLLLIDQDPDQPRTEDNPGFSKESLNELAETIKARGVKSPISIRENPSDPEKFIINHGARRYRASVIAEKTEIPAFIDNNYLEEDQIIENLQRNQLTAREIANFIGKMLSSGKKKGEIAKSIGKSPAFITQHVTLLDLPEPIAEIFNNSRTKDITVINELVTIYKKAPEKVEIWCKNSQEITRASVNLLKEYAKNNEEETFDEIDNIKIEDFNIPKDKNLFKENDKPEGNKNKQTKLKKAIVQVKFNDKPGRIILSRRPSKEGLAWIKSDEDGKEFEAKLTEITLLALMEG